MKSVNMYIDKAVERYTGQCVYPIAQHLINMMNKLYNNIFFKELLSNQMQLDQFLKCQEPFFWAVKKWGHAMEDCVYLETNADICQVYRLNWQDECGNGNDQSHVSTFMQYLKLIGLKSSSICAKPKSIIKFEQYLDLTVNKPTSDRLHVFGTIEFIYIYISHIIHNYVSNQINTQLEIHYSIHSFLDIDHSLNFLNQIKQIDWDIIDQTFNIFLELYTELYKSSLLQYNYLCI